jgi:hypothetical protein
VTVGRAGLDVVRSAGYCTGQLFGKTASMPSRPWLAWGRFFRQDLRSILHNFMELGRTE